MPKTINRAIEPHIIQSLSTFPVVYLSGPRQSGKTTLTQKIANSSHPAEYLSFDDMQIRSAAERDPEAFLRSLSGPVVLDEIQLVPQVFRPLKIIVDEHRNKPDGGKGKFILTGSASVMALPKLSDALVGRMILHNLLPFSVPELPEVNINNFIEAAFNAKWQYTKLKHDNLLKIMRQSSYPELLKIENVSLRYQWCNSYINTILQRDIQVLMQVEKVQTLPDLLRLLATRTGGILNETNLSRGTGLNHITTKKYRLLLENLFLTLSIPAWSNNLGKRLIKAPKIYINDINILEYLLNVELDLLPRENPSLFGQFIENFIAIELNKQLCFTNINAKLYHYRSTSGQEVDFILEGPQNKIVAIEVKARTKILAKDFRHLESLQQELGTNFKSGIVLYQGNEVVSFGESMWAVPIATLWN